MFPDSTKKPAEKENMHPRNLHRRGYDFKQLCKSDEGLRAFVFINKYNNESVDFSDPAAVKALNRALLKHFYGVADWDIPPGYLCPPIPGRADYIHYAADLLGEVNNGAIPRGNKIHALDIGTGANCIYPLIGNSVYGWQFTGTDIDPVAIRWAENRGILNKLILCLQTNSAHIFKNIINPGAHFDLTVCNPPFHSSLKEADAAAAVKWKKLGTGKQAETLNFGGRANELWCKGGEAGFICRMVEESVQVKQQCLWFTTLVSKKDTLPAVYKALKMANALGVKTISMAHGQKVSRIVAWTFLTPEEQTDWKNKFWQ